MHEIQRRLLDLIRREPIDGLPLREIAGKIRKRGEKEFHPQTIKYHLGQLERRGLIEIDQSNGRITRIQHQKRPSSGLRAIPILGSASCGPAQLFADENVRGYLRVSERLVPRGDKVFAVEAIGDSMNEASVNGKPIESGSYVLIDADRREPRDNSYLLVLIDEMATIKRLKIDPKHKRALLVSESSRPYPPIVLEEGDEARSLINGTVLDVLPA